MKLKFVVLCSLLASNLAYAAEKMVTLATLDWQPYIGQDLKQKGLVALIIEAAYKKEGYKVELSFTPWARAVEEAKQGELDGLTPEYLDTSDARKDFVYSDPFFEGPVGFLTLKSKNIKYTKQADLNKTYDELSKYKFGVVRDYINEEKFDKRTFDFKTGKAAGEKNLAVDIADSDETNVKKLDGSRMDLVFIDKYVGAYFIDKLFKDRRANFVFLEPALQVNKLYIAFSKKAKDMEAKKNAFNEGMKKITADGTLKKLIEADSYFK